MPGGAGRREAQRPKVVVTFNYRYAPKHQQIKETLHVGRDRPRDLGGLLLVPGLQPRRRLLPPLAPPAREGRVALGPQGHPPLRPGELVAGRRPRGGHRARAASITTARRARSATRTAAPARTRRSARSTGTSRRTRTWWRSTSSCESADGYLPRRLRLPRGRGHPRHHERGRALLERRQHELLAERVHALRGVPRWPSTAPRAAWRCATTSASPGRSDGGDRDLPDPQLRQAARRSTIPKARAATAAATTGCAT